MPCGRWRRSAAAWATAASPDGQPRKSGAAIDIGVDEFVPDTTPPDVAFDHTPKHRPRRHEAYFTFHASEALTFVCLVDKRPPLPCGSPFEAKFEKRGKHKLVVVATDGSGNVDRTPAKHTWKIKPRKKRHRHQHRPHHGHHHREALRLS